MCLFCAVGSGRTSPGSLCVVLETGGRCCRRPLDWADAAADRCRFLAAIQTAWTGAGRRGPAQPGGGGVAVQTARSHWQAPLCNTRCPPRRQWAYADARVCVCHFYLNLIQIPPSRRCVGADEWSHCEALATGSATRTFSNDKPANDGPRLSPPPHSRETRHWLFVRPDSK